MNQRVILVTAEQAALYLHRLGVRRTSAAAIRQWARRGHIKVHRDGWRRYDLREVAAHARASGLLDN